jgi:transcriptional accessory protein Tex/SPT6
LDLGVEGLVHADDLADALPLHPRQIVQRGDELVLRILHIDSIRERIGLSLKRVSEQERDDWQAEQTDGRTARTDQTGSPVSSSEEMATPLVSEARETSSVGPEHLEEETLRDESDPASVSQPEPEDEDFWINLIENEEAE